jgi:hypothetical protein
MELNYENMLAFIKKNYDFLPTLNGTVEKARELEEYLTADCTIRRNIGPGLLDGKIVIQNRDERVAQLNGHAKEYRAVVSYDPYPLYIAVDDRKHIVTAMLREKYVYPPTGEVYDEIALFAIHELVLDQNKIKMKRELVCPIGGANEFIPGNFS